MYKAVSTKLTLLLVALLAAMVYGCGDGSSTGIISGGDDGMITGKTPEIALLKTVVTRDDETDTSYHFEANMILETDLVVGVRIKEGNETESAILVMREGTDVSEAFSFDAATEISIIHHKDLIDYKWPMQAMNSEAITVSIDYPIQKRPYTISESNQTVLALFVPVELDHHSDHYYFDFVPFLPRKVA